MNSELLILIFIIAFAIAGTCIYLYRKKETLPAAIEPTVEPELAQIFGTVIRDVTFQDALEYSRSSEIVSKGLLSEINSHFSQSTADGLVIGLEVVRSAEARSLILAKFPETTARMLRDDSAVQVITKHGERLLIAVDKKGHKFISQAKQVDPSTASKLSQVGTLVVGAAHIIAGYDNAKKLKSIEGKTDILLARDSNTLIARLSSIYEILKEQTRSGKTSQEFKFHLLSLKQNLKEVRTKFFFDVTDELKRVKNPDSRSVIQKFFSRRRTIAAELNREIAKHEESLRLIRFALHLEEVVSELLGDRDAFSDVTLPEVRRQVFDLVKLIEERQLWITNQKVKGETKQLLDSYLSFDNSLKRA